ncbi:hypothetical protein WL26_17150 [Burkholderia cepacia]|uniref:hypothetical protein n=1 Tax=Burkholderia cepacia TaxID=292 RepID=UPI0007541BE6|nr:hypothetical protein [Burkholderia cepacia]KWA11040.1 hypothetical protein WL26_17150 [Burkholderia cepacia]
MIARVLPITQVKPDLKDSVRMAVSEIERFLAMFHPIDVIRKQQSALAIAGHWLSRVKGFHDDDDFLYLVRDFLSWVLSGGERSLVSDQLSFFFSGFMPSYGTARTFLDIVNDDGTWLDVRAFMHSQAYGNAKRYVESFDWSGGGQKAQAEAKAWVDVLQEEDRKLQAATLGGTVMLAQALPAPGAPVTDVPANDPFFPKPPPSLRVVPPVEAPAAGESVGEAIGSRLAPYLLRLGGMALFTVAIVAMPSNAFEHNTEDEDLRKWRAEYARKKQIAIPAPEVKTDVKVDTLTNECKAQIENNQKNGAKCENDGYTLMEQELHYKRLIDPPKGKGLDGLFEKGDDMSAPNPMPEFVHQPPPGGKLVFIPETTKPPKPQYKALNPEATSAVAYPLFVVFEAKHISKGFDPDDTEGIKKEAKRRLGETCDGTQMSEPWTEERIPQALNRSVKNGDMTRREREQKQNQINSSGYARWIFICLPSPAGSSSKLFVLIDVLGAGMNLEKPSQHSSVQPETDTSGSFA